MGQTITFRRLSRHARVYIRKEYQPKKETPLHSHFCVARPACQGAANLTCLRGTLKTVNRSAHKNVTLSLPEALLRRFRIYAASRNRSMTSLMAEAIREIMDRDADSVKAKRRFLDRIERAPDRGTNGVIRWTRGELHER